MKPIGRRYPMLLQLIYLLAGLFFSTSLLADTHNTLSNSNAASKNLSQLEQLLPQLLVKNFNKKIAY